MNNPPSMLHDGFILLGFAMVFVLVFRRLGLGATLGYLLAGAVVGPQVLGLVGEAEQKLGIAELGITLLLFLVGLELNPRRVWQMRRPIFGMGATQVLATIVVFAAGGWMLGLAPAVALVAGMGIAMSSTDIGLATDEIADERRQHRIRDHDIRKVSLPCSSGVRSFVRFEHRIGKRSGHAVGNPVVGRAIELHGEESTLLFDDQVGVHGNSLVELNEMGRFDGVNGLVFGAEPSRWLGGSLAVRRCERHAR